MNTAKPNKVCKSEIPWWLSFALSALLYVVGLLIICGVYFRRFILTKSRPTIKTELIRRKSRLIMGGGNAHGINSVTDIDSVDEDVADEEDKGLTESAYLAFSLWCERLTSRSTSIGRITCLLQISLNLLSWAIYLAFTYYQNSVNYLEGDCYEKSMIALKWIDLAVNIFFAIHLILRAFASLDILKFWVLPTTLVDICVIPNIIITSSIEVRRQGMSFLRAIYLRYFVDYILVTFGFVKINSRTQIFILIVYLLSVWMIGTGFIHLLENIGDFWTSPTNKQEWTFWESCYFMLITVSTVGYGDYSPKTVLGRVLICVYIIYAYALFASSIPQIVYTFKNSKYHDKYITRTGEKHIIVTGQFENTSIKNFISPFISKRKLKNRNLKLIIMNTEKCDRNLSIYLKKVSSSIKYMVGSALNNHDVHRANIKKAKAAVVLALPALSSQIDEDSENIMTAISLKAQNDKMRVIVQLHLYSNKILLKMFPRWNKNGSDVIICMDEIRLGLMAYNCLVPGIATLMTNLICCNEPLKCESVWKNNYEEGLQNRLYTVEFSDDFNGMPVLEVSLLIYKLFDVVLIAIKSMSDSQDQLVVINPVISNLIIDSESMVAIVMSRDELHAVRVSFYCVKCSPINPTKICKCLIKSVKTQSVNLRTITTTNKQSNRRLLEKPESFTMTDYLPYNMDSIANISIDDTGSFYWTQTPEFSDICIDVKAAESRKISDHILICVCGNGDGTIDLSNFMRPLRFRSLFGDNLRPIVILGNRKYFTNNKWINIKNFPMFVIIDGMPIHARDLRAAGLYNCHSCAIINGNDGPNSASDKQSLFCATLIKSMRNTRSKMFTMITEIRDDETATFFSSLESYDEDSNLPVEHTEPFARGVLFTNSVLYKCIYSIYYNPDIFNFLCALISGPNFVQVEKMFGSGVGLLPRNESKINRIESDVIFQLLPINQPPFSDIPGLYEGTLLYDVLYQWSLEQKILCMGLYRLNFNKKQYVYTNPIKTTEVLLTDKVYCCLSNQVVKSKV